MDYLDRRNRQLDVACGGACLRATLPCVGLGYATPRMGQSARISDQFPSNIVTSFTTQFEAPRKFTIPPLTKAWPRHRFRATAAGATLIKWLHENCFLWLTDRGSDILGIAN